MTYIAGHYNLTFKPQGGSATSIGQTEEGFEIIHDMHTQRITSDEYGDGRAGGIQQGQSAELRLTAIEYDLFKQALFETHPQGDAKTNVGVSLHTLAGEIVATPVVGTTAAAEEGAYTFKYVVPANNLTLLFGSKLRKGPITFELLPDPSTGKLYTVGEGASPPPPP